MRNTVWYEIVTFVICLVFIMGIEVGAVENLKENTKRRIYLKILRQLPIKVN